jgi:4-diphosphocytidyl-2-C-methyl-D-erythritol kinase
MGGTVLGQGRGDVLTRLTPFSDIPVVIANPGFQVSTACAYESLRLTGERKSANILVAEIQQRNVLDVGKELFNIFESVIVEEYPLVREMKEVLTRAGASGALMTGSGPTVFALAPDEFSAQRICEQVSHLADFCIVTGTTSTSIARM